MENMRDVLGLPQDVTFKEGLAKMAYPVTMDLFPLFMENFAYVNYKEFWKNFMYPESKEALQKVLSLTFKDDKIEDLEKLINAGNFQTIITTLMAINGIEAKGEDDGKNQMEV